MSKLRIAKEDNINAKEILENSNKIIEFRQVEKIRNQANRKIQESIHFRPIEMPIMEFGNTEQRKFFNQLLGYKRAV